MIFSTPRGGLHTLWILGHLAYIESQVIQSFMLGRPNPLARWSDLFDGSEVPDDENLFPPFREVLKKCRDVRVETISLLDSFTEEDLDGRSKNAPDGAEELFGTYRRCFQYASDHWLMHRGQLADARQMAGMERMWY